MAVGVVHERGVEDDRLAERTKGCPAGDVGDVGEAGYMLVCRAGAKSSEGEV
jgi:hypothetical protein